MKNWLKGRLITGFFVTVPAFATGWLLWVFWAKVDDIFAPMYERTLGRPVPGLGFLTAVVAILLMGVIARNVAGRRVLAFGDNLLHKVPVFRLLYPSVKMLIDSFSPERRNSFKAVVLVCHPREGAYAFAFVTSQLLLEAPNGKGEMLTVFIPSNNCTSATSWLVPDETWCRRGLTVEKGSASFCPQHRRRGATRLPGSREITAAQPPTALPSASSAPKKKVIRAVDDRDRRRRHRRTDRLERYRGAVLVLGAHDDEQWSAQRGRRRERHQTERRRDQCQSSHRRPVGHGRGDRGAERVAGEGDGGSGRQARGQISHGRRARRPARRDRRRVSRSSPDARKLNRRVARFRRRTPPPPETTPLSMSPPYKGVGGKSPPRLAPLGRATRASSITEPPTSRVAGCSAIMRP